MLTKRKTYLQITAVMAALLNLPALADVVPTGNNAAREIIRVSDDTWQPEGFVNGTSVPATWIKGPDVTIDGTDDEDVWLLATEVEVPLEFGTVERAWLKALYTDDEVFIRVRWEDATEDRQHHPWIWDVEQEIYVAGPQIEDSVMLSFEAGCEWTPHMLGGYIYDFDAWHWLAARSDPLGQALDLYGNVQARDTKLVDFHPFPSRIVEDDWILKFGENHNVNLYADWDELNRTYMLLPVTTQLWVRAVTDGGPQRPAFVEKLPAPTAVPENPAQVYPQFSPITLTGSAAEVAAKGQWQDGHWVVEFRRQRETPVKHMYDTIFNRLVQFSVQIFDHTETLDSSSESGRLFLQFLEKELPPELASDPQIASK